MHVQQQTTRKTSIHIQRTKKSHHQAMTFILQIHTNVFHVPQQNNDSFVSSTVQHQKSALCRDSRETITKHTFTRVREKRKKRTEQPKLKSRHTLELIVHTFQQSHSSPNQSFTLFQSVIRPHHRPC